MIRVMMICFVLLASMQTASLEAQNCTHASNEGCFVLEVSEFEMEAVAQSYGLMIEDRVVHQQDVALVSAPQGGSERQLLQTVRQDPRVRSFEKLGRLSLAETRLDSMADGTGVPIGSLILQGEYSGMEALHFESPVWDGFMSQPAADLVRLPETRALGAEKAQGFGTVAIIDTGIDSDHPVLAGALVPGYDFIENSDGLPSEWDAIHPSVREQLKNDLRSTADQSFASILEGQGRAVSVGPSTRTIVDQSFASILESADLPSAFGHGTMIAGLVRLAAPGAKIMPLRVFDGNGQANPWHVIQAIYFAVENGANVINMSFSIDKQSVELKRAISFAAGQGVVCVSSAGNNAKTSKSWPAAFSSVLGVASTDPQGALSAFSNYGPRLVSLAAPGEELITLYPGGHYAVAWGTSFSAGLVSGTTTLLNADEAIDLFVDYEAAEEVFDVSSVEITSTQEAGSGRLDTYNAFRHGLSGD